MIRVRDCTCLQAPLPASPTTAPEIPLEGWQKTSGHLCATNWAQTLGRVTKKSLEDCKAACSRSVSCAGITHGQQFGHDNLCYLCPDTEMAAFATYDTYIKPHGLAAFVPPDPGFHSTAKALVATLQNNYSYSQLYDIFFERSLSTVRDTKTGACCGKTTLTGGYLLNSWGDVGITGVCRRDLMVSSCDNPLEAWGQTAYNFACAADIIYPVLSDVSSATITTNCGPSKTICQNTLCLKRDDAPLTHEDEVGPLDLSAHGLSTAEVLVVEVQCGIRNKATVCPMEDNGLTVRHCVVKKQCAPPMQVTPKNDHNGKALWPGNQICGASSTGQGCDSAAILGDSALWAAIQAMDAFKRATKRTCATHCAFL